jgi:hypothetical protein
MKSEVRSMKSEVRGMKPEVRHDADRKIIRIEKNK